MPLDSVVHSVVEHQDVDASLHPRMLAKQTHLAHIGTIHLHRQSIIAPLSDFIDDHFGRLR